MTIAARAARGSVEVAHDGAVDSVLTVSLGSGHPVVLVDLKGTGEATTVVNFVRQIFETDAARAAGWSVVEERSGFRAVRAGKSVTFTVHSG